jgi:hypothetical protein
MGITNFKNFNPIDERVGIAEPTLFYTEPIFNGVWQEFLEFYQGDDKKIEKEYHIGYNILKPYITDKITYAQFPVVGIDVNILFIKLTDEEFNKKFKYSINLKKKAGLSRNIAVGGHAVSFGHRNWTGYTKMTEPVKEVSDHGLILCCGVSVDISPSFNISTDKKMIQDEIEETIWHELNHLYEFYNRAISGKGSIYKRNPAQSIASAGINKWGIPKDVYDYWDYNLITHIYMSEPQELNAEIQEAAYTINKYGFSQLKKTRVWKAANVMQSFNADKFIKGLDNAINKYIESRGEQTTALRSGVLSNPLRERLKNMWIQQYEKALKEYGETPSIPLASLKKGNCANFVKYFEKRINRSGDYLKKKLSKLYTVSGEDEDNEKIY